MLPLPTIQTHFFLNLVAIYVRNIKNRSNQEWEAAVTADNRGRSADSAAEAATAEQCSSITTHSFHTERNAFD